MTVRRSRPGSQALTGLAVGLFLLATGSGCFDSGAQICTNGTVEWYCPGSYSCHPTAQCVSPEQVVACDQKSDSDPCATATIDIGHCAFGACLLGTCGDGVPDVGEECDDGLANSDEEPDVCRTGCTSPSCGDGVRDTGELCDDGNQADGDGCSANCQSAEECGNGIEDSGEECDAGQYNSTIPDAACRPGCFEPYCGDGIRDVIAGEQCDDASANSDTIADACREDCTSARCGDGVEDHDEVCDDGNNTMLDGCSVTCDRFEYGWNCASAVAPYNCTRCPPYLTGPGCDQCAVLVDGNTTAQTEDGSSWYSAYRRVQDGIDQAEALVGTRGITACDVWVAEGTYTIYETSVDDTVSLRSYVGVYGGFAAVERTRQERDPAQHTTTLDGENPVDLSRVLHVVSADQTQNATMDGFVIKGGAAQGGGEEGSGGGLYFWQANVHVAHCIITGNTAFGRGGGVYVTGPPGTHTSRVTIEDSTIAGNSAVAQGGGVSNLAVLGASSSLTLRRCTVSGNSAFSGGGVVNQGDISGSASLTLSQCTLSANSASDGAGVYNNSSGGPTSLTLIECTLSDNSADYRGAGIYNYASGDTATLTLRSCVLTGNSAFSGAGIDSHAEQLGTTVLALSRCTLTGNTAYLGGAIRNHADDGTASLNLSSCALEDNGASNGGAVHNDAETGTATAALGSCTLTDNFADFNGGAVVNHAVGATATTSLDLSSCTLAGNSADIGGGFHSRAQAVGSTSSVTARSCILWGNAPNQGYVYPDQGTSNVTVTHSNVQLGWTGAGNIDANPLFVSDTLPYDRRLQSGSPCIDTGHDATAPITDLEGSLRVDIGGVGTAGTFTDMGAHEHNGPPSNPMTVYGDSRYWFSGTMTESQGDAASYCGQFGGTLVAIADQPENDLVQSLLSGAAWMGAYHDTGTTWRWPGAASMTWLQWAGSAPDGSTGSCATVAPTTGLWSADACATPHPFVCEQLAF